MCVRARYSPPYLSFRLVSHVLVMEKETMDYEEK
jgi:hypothetical protein